MNSVDTTNQAASDEVPAIEFRNVTISFGDLIILNRISFKVKKGEMKIIVGLAKSGKSTILKLAMALLRPDEGEILIDGQDVSQLSEQELLEIRGRFGVVLQTDALFSMSVAENVAYRLIEQGKTLEDAEPEIRHVLGLVGLEHAYDLMPDELSGGMSRRVAFARAIAGGPATMFYDSPCSGLDPITSRRILRAILRQRDLHRVSSLLVTSSIDEIKYLSKHFYVPEPGKPAVLKKCPDGSSSENARVLMLADKGIILDAAYGVFSSSEDARIREFLA